MNDVRYETRYVPLGYELNNKKEKTDEEEKTPEVVNNNNENTNFLNLPKGFKIGG